jgi:hypothetical protein
MFGSNLPIVIIGGAIEDWGLIPGFLDTNDPRPARQQIDQHYQGGWQPTAGFALDPDTMALSYPGDPTLRPVSIMLFRREIIALYPGEFVLILQPDTTWEVCRMD